MSSSLEKRAAPPEAIAQVTSMYSLRTTSFWCIRLHSQLYFYPLISTQVVEHGFVQSWAIYALAQTANDLDAAMTFIYDHIGEMDELVRTSEGAASPGDQFAAVATTGLPDLAAGLPPLPRFDASSEGSFAPPAFVDPSAEDMVVAPAWQLATSEDPGVVVPPLGVAARPLAAAAAWACPACTYTNEVGAAGVAPVVCDMCCAPWPGGGALAASTPAAVAPGHALEQPPPIPAQGAASEVPTRDGGGGGGEGGGEGGGGGGDTDGVWGGEGGRGNGCNSGSGGGGAWTCSACTFRNPSGGLPGCGMCGAARGALFSAAQEAALRSPPVAFEAEDVRLARESGVSLAEARRVIVEREAADKVRADGGWLRVKKTKDSRGIRRIALLCEPRPPSASEATCPPTPPQPRQPLVHRPTDPLRRTHVLCR